MTQPRQTIVFGRVSANSEQQKRLAELFAHSGYELLKRIISAHCTEQQVAAMNAGLYGQISDIAADDAKSAVNKAAAYSQALDILDEIAMRQDEWFTAQLEHRP